MAVAFSSGGYPQPPAKIFKRTHVSSERSGAHPTTEEAQPSAVADLIIPPELVPIKKALAATIEASGNLDEHEFKVAIAYTTYAEWRRTNSLPELHKSINFMCTLSSKVSLQCTTQKFGWHGSARARSTLRKPRNSMWPIVILLYL